MSNVRVVIHGGAIPELEKSQRVLEDLKQRGERIARAAGGEPDYEVEPVIGANRARVTVRTATTDAMVAEATQHTLSKAIDAGR